MVQMERGDVTVAVSRGDITLFVSPASLQASRDVEARAVITVRNAGSRSASLSIAIQGLDPSWWSLSIQSAQLQPDGSFTTALTIRPPASADSEATPRSYPFWVRVESSPNADQEARAPVILEVLPSYWYDAETPAILSEDRDVLLAAGPTCAGASRPSVDLIKVVPGPLVAVNAGVLAARRRLPLKAALAIAASLAMLVAAIALIAFLFIGRGLSYEGVFLLGPGERISFPLELPASGSTRVRVSARWSGTSETLHVALVRPGEGEADVRRLASSDVVSFTVDQSNTNRESGGWTLRVVNESSTSTARGTLTWSLSQEE